MAVPDVTEAFVVVYSNGGLWEVVGPIRFKREVAEAHVLVLEADSGSSHSAFFVATLTWSDDDPSGSDRPDVAPVRLRPMRPAPR